MNSNYSLRQYLQNNNVSNSLSDLISAIASSTKEIASVVANAALQGNLGIANSKNAQGEQQKKLDIIANDIVCQHLEKTSLVAGMVSEELAETLTIKKNAHAKYLVFFDPLDGSSNIECNISIGTIFSVVARPQHHNSSLSIDDYLSQSGNKQIASCFAIYGAATLLVLTVGKGVVIFSLDKERNEYIIVHNNVTIANETFEFAINMSNQRFWQQPIKRYIDDCIAGETGVLQKRYNMRWVASMVADVARILTRGGVFLYPIDARTKSQGGKLRLLYEANPIAMIIEQAGGLASTGYNRILDIKPYDIHQRVSVILGSKNEVQRVINYHKQQ